MLTCMKGIVIPDRAIHVNLDRSAFELFDLLEGEGRLRVSCCVRLTGIVMQCGYRSWKEHDRRAGFGLRIPPEIWNTAAQWDNREFINADLIKRRSLSDVLRVNGNAQGAVFSNLQLKITIPTSTYPDPWPLTSYQSIAGNISCISSGSSGSVSGDTLPESDRGIYDDSPKSISLKAICLALLGTVLFALGSMLLFKAWRPPNFNLATNMHVSVDVLVLTSAILIWGGGFIIFVVFGLF